MQTSAASSVGAPSRLQPEKRWLRARPRQRADPRSCNLVQPQLKSRCPFRALTVVEGGSSWNCSSWWCS
eukprot:682710-Alexandrium_andersonii.AAC.1